VSLLAAAPTTNLSHHFQFLLYLVLESVDGASWAPSALTLLHRLLDIHSAATLAPLVPSLEGKAWLSWPPTSHNLQNTLPRRVRARMENCTARGVWALLFERTDAQVAEEEAKWSQWREEDEADRSEGGAKKGSTRSKGRSAASSKPSRAATVDSERTRGTRSRSRSAKNKDDDEGPTFELVSANGWLLLEFLVAFWAKDAAENGGRPEAFLSQLWRPGKDLSFDQADAALEIVRQAVYESTGADARVHRRLAASIIKFLVDAATGRDAKFHPRSLTTALLPLFREPRVSVFVSLLRSSLPSSPNAIAVPIMSYSALTHFLTHAIEDIAGVRSEREAQRQAKRRGKRTRADSSPDHFETDHGLAAPTVEYAISLLGLCADDVDDDGAEQSLTALKLALLTALASNVPSPLWTTVTEKPYALILRVIAVSSEGRARPNEENESILTESTIRLSASPSPSLPLSPSAA